MRVVTTSERARLDVARLKRRCGETVFVDGALVLAAAAWWAGAWCFVSLAVGAGAASFSSETCSVRSAFGFAVSATSR